jgi:hypothetical protein
VQLCIITAKDGCHFAVHKSRNSTQAYCKHEISLRTNPLPSSTANRCTTSRVPRLRSLTTYKYRASSGAHPRTRMRTHTHAHMNVNEQCLLDKIVLVGATVCNHCIAVPVLCTYTCEVASQSSLHPSTYFPGSRCEGIKTLSTIDTGPLGRTRAALKFPLQRPDVWPGISLDSSHGGGKDGSGVSSQLVQSRPATGRGHGLQNGCVGLVGAQCGPRQRAGIGFIALPAAGCVSIDRRHQHHVQ